MNRREAVQYITLLVGGTVIGSSYFLSGCKSKTGVSMVFTDADISLLDEIADTILPATSTPGAKAAKVGQFMTIMVNDCYEAPDQKIFHEGMNKLDETCKSKNGKSFMESSPQQRHDLLVELDKEAIDHQKKISEYYDSLSDAKKQEMVLQKNFTGENPMAVKNRENPDYYFIMMKQLTLLGYFTSEIGCTQARRYVETPGKFEGSIPYKKGDKAFA
ncbi:MAG: gluconate 2-dehydrogenase subunit 3 family protein [Bacteroidota bacterium]|nr:gluconate 2-dehydrogenase subunit 3 family protein [Bacteroidota bacterium]